MGLITQNPLVRPYRYVLRSAECFIYYVGSLIYITQVAIDVGNSILRKSVGV